MTVFTVNVGRVAQSVWRLITGWTVGGLNPDWSEIFRTCPDRSWGPPSLRVHPASCTMGTGSFPGVKSGRGLTLTLHPLLVQ